MQYKNLIDKIGFEPKENASGIFCKKYSECEDYCIEIDIEKEKINFGDLITAESKTTQNFSQAENWVILECVNRLLEKGYNPKNITLEKTWATGHGTSGRLDILVTKDDGTAYLMIECKTYGAEFDKEYKRVVKDGGQLFTYFQQDKNAEVLMLYASEADKNGNIHYVNEIVKIEEDYRQAGNVKDFYDRWNKLPKNNGVFDDWVKPYDFKSQALTPKTLKEIKQSDSSFIFNRFLEILRHNVVSDKPNAFNKIFTLFLCKIYDEKSTAKTKELAFQWIEGIDTHISFQKRLADLYKKGMKEFLDKEVSDLSDKEFEDKFGLHLDESVKQRILDQFTELRLKKNNEFAIKEVFDDESFEDNAKVVKEVVELLQGYKIRYTKRHQYLSDFFEMLLTTGLKQESGQFFTPVPVAQFIIKSIPLDKIVLEKLDQGETDNLLPTIIDYAAGSGHFLTESMHEVQRIIDNKTPDDYIDKTAIQIKKWQLDHFEWAIHYVYGIEKDYRLVKVGKVGCYLHGDGLAKVIHGDGLANFTLAKEYQGRLNSRDKFYPQDNKQFDIVISNPPYSVSAFKGTLKNVETEFDLYNELTDQSSQIECLFIERTKQLLKDGGVAGIILPSSILNNAGIYTKTREIILQYFDIVAIAQLGNNTFMATGTNTVTLFLRKRKNEMCKNVRLLVDRVAINFKDVTINGIEKPVKKYLDHVWENISFEDYTSFLQKNPSKAIEEHEIYQEYWRKITAKTEDEKWDEIIKREMEKLYYFVLAYQQKIVLVKSGEKNEEKQFLGYEFSNRRGNEGIHPIQRGKSIDECTQLFDPEIFDNPEKASTYIYNAFLGDFDTEISESLKNNISRHNLVDMFTLDRVDFDKSISLNLKKKVKIESKWDIFKLHQLAKIVRGASPRPIKQYLTKNKDGVNWIKIGDVSPGSKYVTSSKEKITKEGAEKSRAVKKGDFILSNSMSFGRPYIMATDGCIHDGWLLLSEFDNNLNSDFLYYMLSLEIVQEQFSTLASGGTTVDNLNIDKVSAVQIPLPPKDIQEKIVSEIVTLEDKEKSIYSKMDSLNEQFSDLLYKNSFKTEKLENLAVMLKRGKSAKYGLSDIQVIKSGQARGFKKFDFKQQHFADPSFILDDRQLRKGDVLINSSGVGTAGRVTLFNLDGKFVADSHITILRPDLTKVLPDFVLQSLAAVGFKNIEAMATGQSGQIELSLTTIQNIKIPYPTLEEQKVIVDKGSAIEDEIEALDSQLSDIITQKEEVIRKYI